MRNLRADVTVVGAGLAGLVAADTLRLGGRSVVILEARDRIGGRVHTHTWRNGVPVNVGGEWVGPGQDRMAELLAEHGLRTFRTYTEGANLLEFGGRISEFTGINPGLTAPELDDIDAAQQRFSELATIVNPEKPWLTPGAADLDGRTVQEWLASTLTTERGLRFMAGLIRGIWAVHPAQLSLLHALAYTASAGGFDRLANCEGGAQESRIVGGAHQLPALMADRLDMPVELTSPVRRITLDGDHVQVCSDRLSVSCSSVVVAVPPALVGRIEFDPPLPGAREALQQRAPHGTVIKCAALYGQPFWRSAGLNGQVVADTGPVTLTFDGTPDGSADGVLLGFVEAEDALRVAALTPELRRTEILACFAAYFGKEGYEPLEYTEKLWVDDPWTRGCYGAVFGPGVWTTLGEALRTPVGPVHWAGSETARSWMGYMEGAVESGHRAACEILDRLPVGR